VQSTPDVNTIVVVTVGGLPGFLSRQVALVGVITTPVFARASHHIIIVLAPSGN
jgi:hypothetical protein